jgi:hypothetical protein
MTFFLPPLVQIHYYPTSPVVDSYCHIAMVVGSSELEDSRS